MVSADFIWKIQITTIFEYFKFIQDSNSNSYRKMKDGLKSCNDLVQFGLRPELHPILRSNGKHYLPELATHWQLKRKNILSVPAWGASTHGFLVQHHQTSLSERLVYVQLPFSWLSYDDNGFSRNHNKGHQTDAYQCTHHTVVLLFQYSFIEVDWS
jgi:hypothetical protein